MSALQYSNDPADARPYTTAEFNQDVSDRTEFLEGDDEAMSEAISDLVTGIVTAEERKIMANLGRPIMPNRLREDARARGAIQALRELHNDNPLKVLVMAELRQRAVRDVEKS